MSEIHLTVSAQPMHDAEPLTTIYHADTRIPIVSLHADYPSPSVAIMLGNHDDPARWLRESAAALLSLAEQVDARVTTDA